jgi:hypothetical protein
MAVPPFFEAHGVTDRIAAEYQGPAQAGSIRTTVKRRLFRQRDPMEIFSPGANCRIAVVRVDLLCCRVQISVSTAMIWRSPSSHRKRSGGVSERGSFRWSFFMV